MSNYKLAVLDFETDPFKHDRAPKPFAAEFYSDEYTFVRWGSDCAERIMEDIEALEDPHVIYAHNGGKFDFFMIFPFIDGGAHKIINGRLVKARICGKHQIRDSFSILPVPLAVGEQRKAKWQRYMDSIGGKEAFYALFEEEVREKHKEMILEYLHGDCLDLYEMVFAFRQTFGDNLTVGGTAIRQLLDLHPRERMSPRDDAYYRQFYYGGRVECYAGGVLEGPFQVVDCNSMYPSVMKNYRHPMNGRFRVSDKLPNDWSVPFFAEVTLTNRGALPWREHIKGKVSTVSFGSLVYSHVGEERFGELTFQKDKGRFYVCSHELRVAMELGLVDILKVHRVSVAEEYGDFSKFVDKFYGLRMEAKDKGDAVYTLLWKLVLNSAYGKFGQDPENYHDWYFNRFDKSPGEMRDMGYDIWTEYEEFELWYKPARVHAKSYYDVSIAASITSAARAELLKNLHLSEQPIYCDTDSIICRKFNGVIDPGKLGAWKHEGTFRKAAIAGKKLYAAYEGVNGEKPKLASKGIKASLEDIVSVCEGGEIEYHSAAPTYSWRTYDGVSPRFVSRRVTKTY